jgi:hypothetical protein
VRRGVIGLALMTGLTQGWARPPAAPAPSNAVAAEKTPVDASAPTLVDAIQLLQIGAAQAVEVADDAQAREYLERQVKQPTRVRTIARTVAELGGDNCKRIEMTFHALDIELKTKKGEIQPMVVVMQWSLCAGGMPPEPT